MTPSGERVTVVRPLNTDSRVNLVQISTLIVSLSVDWKFVRRHASSNRSRRGLRRPSSSPKIKWSIAVCLMTPGSAITADT